MGERRGAKGAVPQEASVEGPTAGQIPLPVDTLRWDQHFLGIFLVHVYMMVPVYKPLLSAGVFQSVLSFRREATGKDEQMQKSPTQDPYFN